MLLVVQLYDDLGVYERALECFGVRLGAVCVVRYRTVLYDVSTSLCECECVHVRHTVCLLKQRL